MEFYINNVFPNKWGNLEVQDTRKDRLFILLIIPEIKIIAGNSLLYEVDDSSCWLKLIRYTNEMNLKIILQSGFQKYQTF